MNWNWSKFFYNQHITPIIYEQGSLGASGDLAPLAHLSLPLIAEGEVEFEGQRYTGAEIAKKFNLLPIKLQTQKQVCSISIKGIVSKKITTRQ